MPSIKLFTGHANAWQTHLGAATNMYQKGRENELQRFGLKEESTAILSKDLPVSEYEPMITEEVVNYRFLSSTMIWLDLISSITAGTTPRLLPYYDEVLPSNSQTRLEDVMGCKNWVMVQIGRIAALHEQKYPKLAEGQFDCTEFEYTATDISREIQCRLAQGDFQDCNVSGRDLPTTSNDILNPTDIVTHIFAFMATIYLHLVIHGFQSLNILETTVSAAMRMLQTRVTPDLLPALVCPLYTIGLIAKREDQPFFRNVFSSVPLLNPALQHRRKILPIMEEIWSKGHGTPGFLWKDSLELTREILLV